MLIKLLEVTTDVEWDALAHEVVESSCQSGSLPPVLTTVIAVLSFIIFLFALAMVFMVISRSRKFEETRKSEDYEGLPKLYKALEIILIIMLFRVINLLISLPVTLSNIKSLGTLKDFWGTAENLPPKFSAALQEAVEQAQHNAIISNVAAIALILGLFALAIYAWHCFHKAKSLHAYLFPLGGVHMNPNAPVNQGDKFLPADDRIFGQTGSGELQRGGDENMMRQLFGEETAPKTQQTIPTKKENNNIKKDDDIFGNASASLFAGEQEQENKKEEETVLFKKKQPAPQAAQADNAKKNEELFGSSTSSTFMQNNNDEMEQMRSLLLDDFSEEEKGEVINSDGDIFGTNSTSNHWGMVADEHDPLLSQLLVNEEEKSLEEIGGDVYGSQGGKSTWGSLEDDSLLEGLIAKDEEDAKGAAVPVNTGDVFGEGNDSKWGMVADENDPLLNKLVVNEKKEEEKYNSDDMFGEGANSSWGRVTDEADPLFKSLIED